MKNWLINRGITPKFGPFLSLSTNGISPLFGDMHLFRGR